ncbi:1-acyl-sn-glycerol-3-phosphate acyltransferase [Haloferula luteola]|uniref:1-acyl-sn-glycerol-3-phosphate acyltransferase n=1 Tax=Haloferula luteola TaxID=595692 RepID=A0A840VA54_9BACT|nr:lysophospholipid acyltransferase family protein [Haloferula luteola]MBB5352444.1 1-acyl-sn-glycerol-3-phosphate acyltransferase [Haloferula luteola]
MMRWIYWSGWLLFRSAFQTFFRLRLRNGDKLLMEGPVLVVSNHESFLDPPLIGGLYHDEMVFLARKTLFKGFFKWLYSQWNAVPVDQEKPDMSSLKTIIRELKSGRRVLVFPEGARTLDGALGEAQPGVGLIAAKAGVPIQPIRIRGAREALPRGSGRIRLATIEVTIGDPIDLAAEGLAGSKDKEAYQRIADRLMAAIAEL